ncbi:MAG: hypothetical protein AAFQ82_10200 [Myxococcota bacterium]
MKDMSFREKSAWIVFSGLSVVFGGYFGAMAWSIAQGDGPYGFFGLFLIGLALLVASQIIGHSVIALRGPEDARTPRDERDDWVEMRSARIALPVLGGLVLLAIGSIHFGATAPGLANLVLLAVVIGALVQYGAKIRLYRNS